MAYSAIASVRHLIDEYHSYLRTSYRFYDETLRRQFEQYLAGEEVVVKGPYVTLAREFTRGAPLRQLTEEGIAHPDLLKAHWVFQNDPLFQHQEKAFRLSRQDHNVLITTGTGSGKTEAFLLPILDGILRRKAQGPVQGVQAILLYPMNALANDQLERLRELLADPALNISFGLYTGDSDNATRNLKGNPAPHERLTHEQIRRNPPDILLTNYKQLEFLLVRRQDRELFKSDLRFLVLDEIHSYRGALATEIACLIRRVKAHAGLVAGQLRCLGTSATVASDIGQGALAEFADQLFGEKFTTDDIVAEAVIDLPSLAQPYVPDPAVLTDSDLEDICIECPDKVEALAAKLCGRSLPLAGTSLGRIEELLAQNQILRSLEDLFHSQAASIDDACEYLKQNYLNRRNLAQEQIRLEVEAYLLLASLGDDDHPPRLRPKLHTFFHGVYEFHICTNPNCRKLLPHGMEKCDQCGSVARPVSLCRTCGQDFFKVRLSEDDPAQTAGTSDFYSHNLTAYITHRIHAADDEEEDSENDNSDGEEKTGKPKRVKRRKTIKGMEEIWYCPTCGRLADEPGTCQTCAGPMIHALIHHDKLNTCPACGATNHRQDIVAPLRTGTASSVAVLTERTLDYLDDAERRLLVFADNRQDVAHQAGYTADKHRNFLMRHLIYQEVRRAGREGLALTALPQKLLDRFLELKVIEQMPAQQQRQTWAEAFAIETAFDFTSRAKQRLSLEKLGMISVQYDFLDALAQDSDFGTWAKDAGLTVSKAIHLVAALLDTMRRERAVDFDFFQQYINPERESRFRTLEEEPYNLRIPERERSPRGYVLDRPEYVRRANRGHKGFYQENPSAGQLCAWQKILIKFTGVDRQASVGLISRLVSLLAREDMPLLVKAAPRFPWPSTPPHEGSAKKPVWQVNRHAIILTVLYEPKRCSACLTWLPQDREICPNPSCSQGELRPQALDPGNYYARIYSRIEPKKLVVKEHSAQIPDEERVIRETEFKEKKTNVLVCTPTLELGVDIGPLLSVVLRQSPPTPANYIQRVGRAGRRLRIGFVSTFCSGGSHDRHVFEEPEWMVAGRFQPPRIRLDNPKVVSRHLNSYILESLEAELPSFMKEFLDNETAPTTWKPAVIQELFAEVAARRAEVCGNLEAVFAEDQKNGRAARYDQTFCQNLVNQFNRRLEDILNAWWKRVELLKKEYLELDQIGSKPQDKKKAAARARAFREITTDRERAYTLAYLSTQDFLPAYQFPVDTFSLEPGVTDTNTIFRGAAIAIEEFAPGNYVYANGHKLKSIRVLYAGGPGKTGGGPARTDAESSGRLRSLSFCHHCGEAAEDVVNTCPRCGQPMHGLTDVVFVNSFEAEDNLRIGSDEESRERQYFDRRENLLVKTTDKAVFYDYPFTPLELRPQADVLITNWGKLDGKDGEGARFKLCPDCGRHEPPGKPTKRKKKETDEEVSKWQAYHQKFCAGTPRELVLGHQFRTDALVLRMANPLDARKRGNSSYSHTMITLAEALLAGAAEVLELEPFELSAFTRKHREDSEIEEIVFYENVAGGAGYVEEMAGRFPEVAKAALERLFNHECPGACYQCLKHYRNQQWHNFLDKYRVWDHLILFSELAPIEGRTLDNGKVESTLKETLARRKEEIHRQSHRPGLEGPQSPIEVKLLEAMRKIPELSQVLLQESVTDPLSNTVITIPDFIFRDEKIAIFCDGYAYHGDKDTLELDARKRNRLQELGWVVFTYWGRLLYRDPQYCAVQIKRMVTARKK